MQNLTKRQKEILDYISMYSKKKGYAPTIEEIRRKFKLNAISTVHQHVQTLIKKGKLQKSSSSPRSLEILTNYETIQVKVKYILRDCGIFQIKSKKTFLALDFGSKKTLFACKVKTRILSKFKIKRDDILFCQKNFPQKINDNVLIFSGGKYSIKKGIESDNEHKCAIGVIKYLFRNYN